MKIYTTCFTNLKDLPENVISVAISRTVPSWYGGYRWLRLAPSQSILSDYHKFRNKDRYKKRFTDEILDLIDPGTLRTEIENFIQPGCTIVLVCYERPPKFCHRHLVADWLRGLGYEVEEWRN